MATMQNLRAPRTGRPFRALALILALLAGCATSQSTAPGKVGVERRQTLWVSAEEINQAAVRAYADALGKARNEHALNRDPQLVARVRAVAGRLIPVTAVFRPDAPGWKWGVNVVDSPELNAWCMPGGKMAVYSGLVERLQLSEDELAAVMGHEIAHALREHGRERASQAMATNFGLSIAGAALGAGRAQMDLAGLLTELTISLPNSRQFEAEADRVGVELAARAGYDPRAVLDLWRKMQKAGGASPPQWLSTHPSHENRLRDLADYSQRVMPLYRAAR